MPLKERISTMLHIHTGQISTQNSYHSQPTIGTSPPHTPASINTTSTAATDPLSSPITITTSSVYAKSSPDTISSSRQNSSGTPPPENAVVSPKTGASRLTSRLSTLPKRILRHKQAPSQSNTLSCFPLPPSGSCNSRPPSQQYNAPPPPLTRPLTGSRGSSWRGHKHTKSALGAPTITITSTPMVIAQPQPKRPLTYHQPTDQTPFLYAAQSEFIAGPHPGQPYNPFEQQPSPEPQPKSATDCWEDDPPHVRRRLQNRHWEVLFGDFSWTGASSRRSRSTTVEKAKRHDWGGISPRSRSPSCSDGGEDRESFWVREGEERGRQRLRTPTWVEKGNRHCPSPDVLQARELAEKLARVRMKR